MNLSQISLLWNNVSENGGCQPYLPFIYPIVFCIKFHLILPYAISVTTKGDRGWISSWTKVYTLDLRMFNHLLTILCPIWTTHIKMSNYMNMVLLRKDVQKLIHILYKFVSKKAWPNRHHICEWKNSLSAMNVDDTPLARVVPSYPQLLSTHYSHTCGQTMSKGAVILSRGFSGPLELSQPVYRVIQTL